MSFDQKARGKPQLDVHVIRAGEDGSPFQQIVKDGKVVKAALDRWHHDLAKRLSTDPAYQPIRNGWDVIVTHLPKTMEWQVRVHAPDHGLHGDTVLHPHDMAAVEAAVLDHKATLDEAHRNGG